MNQNLILYSKGFMKKKEITEKTIEHYMNYLLNIRICYGSARCMEHLKYAINGAKENYTPDAVKQLKVELKSRLSKYEWL